MLALMQRLRSLPTLRPSHVPCFALHQNGRQPPEEPPQTKGTFVGKNENSPLGKSGLPIFGTHTFGTPLDPPSASPSTATSSNHASRCVVSLWWEGVRGGGGTRRGGGGEGGVWVCAKRVCSKNGLIRFSQRRITSKRGC